MNTKELILQTNGKIFGITFIKKDGTLRTMSARLGVNKGIKGKAQRKEEDERFNLLTVFDLNADRKSNSEKGGYRRINLRTVKILTINGTKYF